MCVVSPNFPMWGLENNLTTEGHPFTHTPNKNQKRTKKGHYFVWRKHFSCLVKKVKGSLFISFLHHIFTEYKKDKGLQFCFRDTKLFVKYERVSYFQKERRQRKHSTKEFWVTSFIYFMLIHEVFSRSLTFGQSYVVVGGIVMSDGRVTPVGEVHWKDLVGSKSS